MGVVDGGTIVGVALDTLSLQPLDPGVCQLALAVGDDPPCLVAGAVEVCLEQPQVRRADHLDVTTSRPHRRCGALRVAPHVGAWTLHADGAPLMPLDRPVQIRCLVDRIEQLTA